MPLKPNTRLGNYEVLSLLGAGGMGEVYRGRDTRLERTVAIKVLHPRLAAKPELVERFEREARTVASLQHPNICVLFDVGHQDGVHFLVLEYLEGETLATRLLKGPLPLDQVYRYGTQIADALDKAHRTGVTHRDVKPGNIMLVPGMQDGVGTKLLDFGLAKLKQEAGQGLVLDSQAPTRAGRRARRRGALRAGSARQLPRPSAPHAGRGVLSARHLGGRAVHRELPALGGRQGLPADGGQSR